MSTSEWRCYFNLSSRQVLNWSLGRGLPSLGGGRHRSWRWRVLSGITQWWWSLWRWWRRVCDEMLNQQKAAISANTCEQSAEQSMQNVNLFSDKRNSIISQKDKYRNGKSHENDVLPMQLLWVAFFFTCDSGWELWHGHWSELWVFIAHWSSIKIIIIIWMIMLIIIVEW